MPCERVVSDEYWRVAHSFNTAVPGWLVLLPRRHVTAVHDLTDAEAGALGVWQVRLSRAPMGLLEERELSARQRLEKCREDAERAAAALAVAERACERAVIAREEFAAALAEARAADGPPPDSARPRRPARSCPIGGRAFSRPSSPRTTSGSSGPWRRRCRREPGR
ncbi:HIT family protein [Streptomyces sp. NBC_01483]|uniref:HIT family protein n=1 Tax=Streptomyces sp. NBC_01483 TaxID=2903883 RepID=UPI002E2EDFB5|nr:hypothetical protein [Streptomyces sp. NBC_01483]